MKRIALLLSAAILATSMAIFAPVSPASANQPDACAGTGTAGVSAPGVLYPGLGSVLAGFTITLTGVCVVKASLTATGTVHGYCGLSTGNGTTNNGHNFSWIGVGSMLVLYLEVVGAVNATPNALANESCATGALSFIVTGAAVLVEGL